MHPVIYTFLENMAFIIAFVFLGLKLQQLLLGIKKTLILNNWIFPLFFSFLSLWVIKFMPFHFDGIRLDLRSAPLFLVSYLGGWKVGTVAIILPSIYRIYLGGPTVIEGITQGIFLPFFIGAVFHIIHNREKYRAFKTTINIKKMMSALLLFEVSQALLILWTTPATFIIVLNIFLFSTLAVLGMGLMINDFNNAYLQNMQLQFLSNYDQLTQIPNIRFFKDKVQGLIYEKKPITIAMFDVDFFKNYNDTHGHPAGDVVLRTIGQILKDNMRELDISARYGGEEFIICFQNPGNIENVRKLADNLRLKVKEYAFYGEETQPNQDITISIGISHSSGDSTLKELIEEADKALYKAKNNGRNRIEVI